MSLISVIMSTYREPVAYIEPAVRSILNQTHGELELIIVLDDPHNGQAESLVSQLAKEDPRVTVLKNETNLGLVGSLNKALAHAGGAYIARMDADDFSYPNRLETQLQYMKDNQLDMVGALVQYMDPNGQWIPGEKTRHYAPEQVNKRMMLTACLPHPTWLVKKEIYAEMNGYRQMPRCEDYDFLLRARKKGFRIGICDACLLDYRINPHGISQSGLLEQRLTGRYLVDNYHRIEEVSPEEVERMVRTCATEKAFRAYAKADALFRQAKAVRKESKIKAGGLLLKSMAVSKHYRTKIIGMIKLKLID